MRGDGMIATWRWLGGAGTATDAASWALVEGGGTESGTPSVDDLVMTPAGAITVTAANILDPGFWNDAQAALVSTTVDSGFVLVSPPPLNTYY